MNAKLSKTLRKIAYSLVMRAENDPAVKIKKVTYEQTRSGTVTVTSKTWKGAYKSLKKTARNGGADTSDRPATRTKVGAL